MAGCKQFGQKRWTDKTRDRIQALSPLLGPLAIVAAVAVMPLVAIIGVFFLTREQLGTKGNRRRVYYLSAVRDRATGGFVRCVCFRAIWLAYPSCCSACSATSLARSCSSRSSNCPPPRCTSCPRFATHVLQIYKWFCCCLHRRVNEATDGFPPDEVLVVVEKPAESIV